MPRFARLALFCLLFTCLTLPTVSALSQSQMRPGITDGDFDPTAPPPEMRGVTINQILGAAVPISGGLVDEQDQRVTLNELLDDGVPIVLDLGYYECPLLCPTVKKGITRAVKESSFTLGQDYRIVSISIDHEETPAVARSEQARVLKSPEFAEIENPEQQWRFLTGPEPAVRSIADAVGYGYKYLPQQDEFGHAAGIVFLSPDGTVSSYLLGVDYPGRQFDLAISDAKEGQTGSVIMMALQFCFAFDPSAGKYVLVAKNAMMLGGAVTLAVVGGAVGGLFWWERRRKGKATKREDHELAQPV
ncbi:MAG: SCO family protein [Planctomycetota bacterium]